MKSKVLLSLVALFTLCSCGSGDKPLDTSNATKLSFKDASSYDDLLTLNNKTVQINGYMATSSPVDGSFIFLMNLPYQSCPFCKPNTSELSNTMEVFPKNNEKFSYTSSAIKVVGTLIVNTDLDNPFVDDYGYTFNFKIVDAEYRILKDSELTGNYALFQKVANSGLSQDLYNMYDYLNFICKWPTYYVIQSRDSNGNPTSGFYLWPSDITHFTSSTDDQFGYAMVDGYFDDLISRFRKISATEFEDIVSNIQRAKALSEYAWSEIEAENYTSSNKYVELFHESQVVYEMNDTTLGDQSDALYYEFTDWLGSFEM